MKRRIWYAHGVGGEEGRGKGAEVRVRDVDVSALAVVSDIDAKLVALFKFCDVDAGGQSEAE